MRDSFIFYRSFYDSFKELPKRDRTALFEALCNYALNDVEPELSGIPAAIFNLLKPQVDANNRRYENGCKGGRPKQNQTETKTKPNNYLKVTKTKRNDNVNDNVNENDNVHDNDNAVGIRRGRKSDDKFNLWNMLSPDDRDKIYEVYPESGGLLIDAVYEQVKKLRTEVKDPVKYILGYAKNVGWDDNAEHFDI